MILYQEVKSRLKLVGEDHEKEFVAHAYTTVSCAAAIYAAAAAMGDMTEEVTMVKLNKVITGEVQYEFTLWGRGSP